MVARNIIKNLAAAEDIVHGVGTVQQTRNGQPLTLHKVDIPLGLATVADLVGVNPTINPRVRIGNTELEYINGDWQERLTFAPYPLVVGLTLDNRYNMVIKDGVVAKYAGTLPYITTGAEDITVAPWQVLISTGSGGTSGNGIIYSNVLPSTIDEGVTYFNAEKMEQVYSYNDGDSVQYLAVPLLAGSGGTTAGNGAGGTSTIAPAVGTDVSLVAITSTDAAHKIKVLKQGANVTLVSDGTSVTVNANAGGISYTAPASTLVVGTTFFNPDKFEMSFAYNDGNSSQYVTFPLAKPLGGGSGGGTTDHSLLSNRGIVDQHPIAAITGLQAALDSKQAVLVSGTNIKTINGTSILGSGNIVISGGGGTTDHAALSNRDAVDQHPIAAITGLQTALNAKASTDVATTSVSGLMSATDKTKLNGIATGATANSSDATLLSRANHTGTQAISTVTGLQTALDSKQATDADLTALAGLSNGVPKRTGDGTWTALVDIKEIVVSTTAPTDTSKLWLDIN